MSKEQTHNSLQLQQRDTKSSIQDCHEPNQDTQTSVQDRIASLRAKLSTYKISQEACQQQRNEEQAKLFLLLDKAFYIQTNLGTSSLPSQENQHSTQIEENLPHTASTTTTQQNDRMLGSWFKEALSRLATNINKLNPFRSRSYPNVVQSASNEASNMLVGQNWNTPNTAVSEKDFLSSIQSDEIISTTDSQTQEKMQLNELMEEIKSIKQKILSIDHELSELASRISELEKELTTLELQKEETKEELCNQIEGDESLHINQGNTLIEDYENEPDYIMQDAALFDAYRGKIENYESEIRAYENGLDESETWGVSHSV